MKRLLLAGAGHAHLHLLRQLAGRPWSGVEVTLLAPYPRQIYSGMIPGWIAGHYPLEACAAPLAPLVQRSGVRWLHDRVVAMDAGAQTVECGEAGRIGYDLLSVDTGAGIDASAWKDSDHFLPIRPLEEFVAGWEARKTAILPGGSARVAVVGGGAAGVELALAVDYALRRNLPNDAVFVVIVSSGGLLAGHGPKVVELAERTLAERGITLVHGRAAPHALGLELAGGSPIPADLVILATGVVAPSWLAASGLALADGGFIAVGDGQQSISHPDVFAAGDVASRIDRPHAKSGVYAVRAGPVLTRNLARAVRGEPSIPYMPQKRSLYLLATGPREAIFSWGPIALRGGWAWRLKDFIDRRFMRQYQSAWTA